MKQVIEESSTGTNRGSTALGSVSLVAGELRRNDGSASLFERLRLPNGAIIPNRIAKAAMEENMADDAQGPSESLFRLYQAWAEGGAGLIISGNVMIDRHAMTGPGGVVLEDDRQLDKFRRWARTGRSGGAQFWLQVNHPGRQMRASMGQQTWAPSAVPLDLGTMSRRFTVPQEMTPEKIQDVVDRFARASQLAEEAGFTGVQIHAAHGYLLSQFLSPLSNRRADQWGGPLENRARLLMDVVRRVRDVVSPQFAVAVKLNSADFQRGGFTADDARQVIGLLNALGVDLVELSGGSYEAPAMQGVTRDGQTLAREAYFLEFARDIGAAATMPVMVTGGIRRHRVAEEVIKTGVDMVGIGTALALDPNLPNDWRDNRDRSPELRTREWKDKRLSFLANMAGVKLQLRRLGSGRPANPDVSPIWALVSQQAGEFLRARRYRRLMAGYQLLSPGR